MPDDSASPVLPKQESHLRDDSVSSVGSAADADGDGESNGQVDGHTWPVQIAPVQKRKGGRKPIYATSEERKQRNRQAQAAFRERRTEYIKQLEATIKQHEESLQSFQQSHRSAADECLVLRYKNSLLERILLESGIDVQTELKRKEISSADSVPESTPYPTLVHKPGPSRHRHIPRLSSGSISIVPGAAAYHSPQIKSSPSSQISSPASAKSPGFAGHSEMSLSHHDYHNPQQQIRSSTYPSLSEAATQPGLQPIAPDFGNAHGQGHWPSPYQTHNEQLEQEYGANTDIMDDTNELVDNVHAGPGPYPQRFEQRQPPFTCGPHGVPITMAANVQSGLGQMFDAADSVLDVDPFGMTAGMHFPTPFSFHESSIRR